MADFEATVMNLTRNGSDLTLRQLSVLLLCRRNAGSPEDRQTKTFAEAMNVAKSAITRASEKLEMMDLLKRSGLAADKRACVMTLTKKGAALAEQVVAGG